MRVTNSMMVSNMMRNLNSNLRRLDKQQTLIGSGKKIRFASDDPIIAAKALTLRGDLAELEQHNRNANDALSWLEITESAVKDMGDVLQRVRELTVQAADGAKTTEDKQKIQTEMEQLKKQLISCGNTTYAGRYIFSGYNTNEKLFDEDGNYNIDVTTFTLENRPSTAYEIGIGDDIQVSTNGIDIFGYEEINSLLGKLPHNASNTEEAKQAELKATSAFDLSSNFTLGLDPNAVRITIDAPPTVYTVDSAVLGGLDGSTNLINKQDVLNVIKSADDGGGNTLGQKADVFFDSSGILQIRSKSYGTNSEVQIDFTGGGVTVADLESAFGITSGTNVNGSEASIESTETLTDGDVTNDAFEGAEILVNLNGESKRVKIGTVAPPENIDDLIDAINIAFNAEYAPGTIVASKVDKGGGNYSIKFTTGNTSDKPNLNVDVVKVKESSLLKDIDDLMEAMNSGDEEKISEFLDKIDGHSERILSVRADIGARVNRMELIQSRIQDNNTSYTALLSKNEDIDMAEAIMNSKMMENIYRASLSVGAQAIQPTLIDFIR